MGSFIQSFATAVFLTPVFSYHTLGCLVYVKQKDLWPRKNKVCVMFTKDRVRAFFYSADGIVLISGIVPVKSLGTTGTLHQ